MPEKKKKDEVVTHFFNRRKYKVLFQNKEELRGDDKSLRKAVAWCDHPAETDKAIAILEHQSEEEILDCIVHEAIHGLSWGTKEKKVCSMASSIARLLWKLGYRRIRT